MPLGRFRSNTRPDALEYPSRSGLSADLGGDGAPTRAPKGAGRSRRPRRVSTRGVGSWARGPAAVGGEEGSAWSRSPARRRSHSRAKRRAATTAYPAGGSGSTATARTGRAPVGRDLLTLPLPLLKLYDGTGGHDGAVGNPPGSTRRRPDVVNLLSLANVLTGARPGRRRQFTVPGRPGDRRRDVQLRPRCSIRGGLCQSADQHGHGDADRRDGRHQLRC